MNILLISQCSKNALVQTRRILDQFAERCGTRTWQTAITQQGLQTLKTLLKRSARKNTAVACHWIRSKNHTELLWIVGNAQLFNEKGSVPTHVTRRDILRRQSENDWHTLHDIRILAAIAALFHDFGKASQAFQAKLKSKKKVADAYRHEWVSLRLFQAFVGQGSDDKDWLTRLAALTRDQSNRAQKSCLDALIRDGLDQNAYSPFDDMPALAKTIGWLILTHHHLPCSLDQNKTALNNVLTLMSPSWNRARLNATEKDKKACWQFNKGLAFASQAWRVKASYWGELALQRPQLSKKDWLSDGYSLHLARLSLILADHHYSRLPANSEPGDPDFPLYANTDSKYINADTNLHPLKQRLDEHLIGVAKHTKNIVRSLPLLSRALPSIARHKGFKQRTTDPRFRWQDQAYDLACSLRERSVEQGFFGINMASTGCGKTLANGRIMYGLANPSHGARFSIALGLRTLTLQTGQAYRERLGLGDDDIAVLVGSAAVRDLFEWGNKQHAQPEPESLQKLAACGSESAETLLPDNSYVHFEGALNAGSLRKWLENNSQIQKLLAAPILVSTIDHLIGATEAVSGGKQIAPMLRLLTSDLVLDEPDDFDIDDLPALTRLVHWAGMLGSRVLISSATLAPALIEGLFNAYSEGRKLFQQSRGIPAKPTHICCAWFDEYGAIASDHAEAVSFVQAHQQFITKSIEKLHQVEIRRRAVIKPLTINNQLPIREQVADAIHLMAYELHAQHHSMDPDTGKRVSFGVVRMANIDPLIDVAKHLFKKGARENYHIRLCCYHSRHPLLARAKIEQQLDNLLNRKQPDKQFFAKRELREILTASPEQNIIFIVLASPVAEVGRDHDYDWSIVEPSSMRSIIQLAGRVRRHRSGICSSPNLYLLGTNLKSLEGQRASYCKPGFEKETNQKEFLLHSHDLAELLTPVQYESISAEPRIQAGKSLNPNANLADLEHARLQALMLADMDMQGLPVCLWWQSQAMLTGFLQSKTPFRYDPIKQTRYGLWLDEDEEMLRFFNIEGEQPVKVERTLFECVDLELGERIQSWINFDYFTLLTDLAEALDMDLLNCGKRYGWVSLPQNKANTSKWCYNAVLGLRRKES